MGKGFKKGDVIKIKAKYHFACARCGATENIQTHDPTGKHENWRDGVALCGLCHSKEHPDRPARLFLVKRFQPSWPNISAASLAKEFGCCSRTIIRRARKLGIPFGQPLSPEDKERLRLGAGTQGMSEEDIQRFLSWYNKRQEEIERQALR